MGLYHGRSATLAHQFETAFRTEPGVPATQLLKFSKLTGGREAELVDDPTINNNALMEKRDEVDSIAPMNVEAILCLADIGYWLTMLLGAPVTSGPVGGLYTHVFTLSLNDRPTSLFELSLTENDAAPSTRYHRHLGVMLNSMEWDIVEADQSWKGDLVGAVEKRPYPVAAFDVAPTAVLAKSRACKKNGRVWDGAASIGEISKTSVKFENDLQGFSLADGQEGLGRIQLGQPKVGGTMDVLFTESSLVDDALARTSKHLVLVSKNSDGTHSLTVDIPQAEFDVPRVKVETSKGIVVSGLNWMAHRGATPVTVTLVNAVPTYA